ncbi:MAG: trifunctional transcriptional regulator/proline dehydrogenase/L-glutamate gamma-semialdehyde dehydrogenase [Burkholderiaceae bacterium]|nr:trifunctional transcriptional regulator/proline dehydrogenase/L-glutamate gamma-semialdehyde dehydrogenase [Burkholderiaceae bacterium]
MPHLGAADAPGFTTPLTRTPLRDAISTAYRRAEPEAVPALLPQARLDDAQHASTQALARQLAQALRERKTSVGRAGLVQGLLQEFALSSQEGVALMCLAEALLRIPDAATRDALIRDKIGSGDWQPHVGASPSLFVNAAAWGLLLTGKLVATHSEAGLGAALRRVVGRSGEPLIRKGVDMAMRLMGEQFVTGETIEQALANARRREAEGFRYSYDMLGEAALTMRDAEAYQAAYEQAIQAIGQASAGRGIYEGPGISIKLSALHPRYSRAQMQRVLDELYPRLLRLALLARQHDIGLNIDAEEADRLELSLELLERLCFEGGLAGWNGIGFVIQAYQKRCPALIDHLVDLAQRSGHRLMLRLVKGAYWDSEIKRAQVDGLDGYPVYTRKAYTDVAYIACARQLLAAPGQVYPQFATHNAHTLAAIHTLAGQNYYAGQYEFQCLHGMGEPLYEQVVGSNVSPQGHRFAASAPPGGNREAWGGPALPGLGRPCRIYAPVGTHETLLAYLVRRLLENGANTSFVNRIADASLSLDELVMDPVLSVQQMAEREGVVGLPHPAIPLPRNLYGAARENSRGVDLGDSLHLDALTISLAQGATQPWQAAPMLGIDRPPGPGRVVTNPADGDDSVGQVHEADAEAIEAALQCAQASAPAWAATAPTQRAAALERAAEQLEADTDRLMGLLMREAGKTAANAVAEVREAVDFLRYYALQVRRDFDNTTHRPLGPVLCISPWNFPLAIFTGQVAAALAAGNVVLAKPAEQTPLVAAEAVRVLWAAGVPRGALQLLPGRGETVGAPLVADARVMGVMFTGSTEVARLLQRQLAKRLNPDGRPVPLIAETGGQNAMLVDSSALVEQVVIDVLASAFDSAGQRCSALRVLCVQDEVADRVFEMLEGAVRELNVGNPAQLAVDVGPVIDLEAQATIQRHIEAMRAKGRRVAQPAAADAEVLARGSFVLPTLIEIDSLAELQREVFGPVLHLLRYRREQLDTLLGQVQATGYALTMGLHTRIDETIARVVEQSHAGNLYVNRNMVGAVVGVQPFGGEALSGTGPKAGGPLYLLRLLAARPDAAPAQALRHSGADAAPLRGVASPAPLLLQALRDWAVATGRAPLAALCERFATDAPPLAPRTLAGPTGESNLYRLLPREAVLCLADDEADRLAQFAAVLAVGGRVLWPAEAGALAERLPEVLRDRVTLAQDWTRATVHFDALLHHGDAGARRSLCGQMAERAGPIVGVIALEPGQHAIPLERLVVERALSINTAAAGGNASLMTID